MVVVLVVVVVVVTGARGCTGGDRNDNVAEGGRGHSPDVLAGVGERE